MLVHGPAEDPTTFGWVDRLTRIAGQAVLGASQTRHLVVLEAYRESFG